MRVALLLSPGAPPVIVEDVAVAVILDDRNVVLGIASARPGGTMVTADDKADFQEEARRERVIDLLRAGNIAATVPDCAVIRS